ncbi:MAG: hypothetical protein IJP35_03210, partial [Clostridia bacterium]|nr:hypothetical protein [Clostridia bacterium]
MKRADFCSIEAQNAANTFVLASISTKSERKSAFSKRGSSFHAHPKLTGLEPVTISLAAFIRRILCSFLKGASLPANSHFI